MGIDIKEYGRYIIDKLRDVKWVDWCARELRCILCGAMLTKYEIELMCRVCLKCSSDEDKTYEKIYKEYYGEGRDIKNYAYGLIERIYGEAYPLVRVYYGDKEKVNRIKKER